MKALTVQQPWAWAIVHGGKLIENRTQLWSYRGPLAIHAGARWSDRGALSTLVQGAVMREDGSASLTYGRLQAHRFTFGAIIGVAELVDCHPDAGCCKPWGESAYVEHGGRERRRITHLVLENPRPLPEPIPCKGALGLWTPPADILGQLQAAANA
ncbi:hypothetical protein A5742_25435 [Mycolicibacterium fortuitum]|uniref:ASCH domain-containing protein n=1 Tax=Mycolicibacterium fortuitum TaxID=1766 RepID=A0ABD6QN84_MYCFO|nr:hypothetical protein [Mycolicibacterium fortuitum]OMC46878.1 hypothetical protein A5742_25435 [Mycolicibacterium fortuitum]